MGGNEISSDQEKEWKNLEKKMRDALRLRQRSLRTEKTYLAWVRSFRAWMDNKPATGLKGLDLRDHLSHLSVEKKIAPSTQNQAGHPAFITAVSIPL